MSVWLIVTSADHVARGVELGIVQVNHGKRAGLARMQRGDTIVYYSPTSTRGGAEKLQQFTALGVVDGDEIWQADEGSFQPFRRSARYMHAHAADLAPLKGQLELTSQPNWGYRLRLGLLNLSEDDAAILTAAMMAP